LVELNKQLPNNNEGTGRIEEDVTPLATDPSEVAELISEIEELEAALKEKEERLASVLVLLDNDKANNTKGTRKRKRQCRLLPATVTSLDKFRDIKSAEKGGRVSRDEAIEILLHAEENQKKKVKRGRKDTTEEVHQEIWQSCSILNPRF
jgi:hypothetical protein